jgi:hypothetical protein
MSNELPNDSDRSNSVHTAKNEAPAPEMVLLINRVFTAWQWMVRYCQKSIWQNGECKPEKCAETICDFTATLLLSSWKDRINSTESGPKHNVDGVAILRVAMKGSKEEVAQAIINVGEEKWSGVCDWVAQGLPELLEFGKLKPDPFDKQFVIEIAMLENYGNDAKALRELMDRRSNRWPVIRDLARSKFGHQTFTWKTMECLCDWLLTQCENDVNQRGSLTLTDVEVLLKSVNKNEHFAAHPANGTAWQENACTLGWLIDRLRRNEHIRPWFAKKNAEILVKWGAEEAAKWRAQYVNDLFEPDPASMPGIDRIELLCDELGDGAGLTVANVRKVRAKVCRVLGCTIASADALSLDNAAAAMGMKAPLGKDGKPPSRKIGKKPLEEGNPLKLQVYERIKLERENGLRPAKILERLKGDKEFAAQVQEAGLTLNKKLLNAAKAFFNQPNRKMKEAKLS